MELRYSKKEVYNILRYLGYYMLLGLAFNLVFFLFIWYWSELPIRRVYYEPKLSPYEGLGFWFLLGLLRGWYMRKKAFKLTLRRWSTSFIILLVFTFFISTLQIYYVNRQHDGWWSMLQIAKGEDATTCIDKYHSFWLIKDKGYWTRIDNCLIGQKVSKDYYKKGVNYDHAIQRNHMNGNFEGIYADYDILSPQIIWLLIIFIIVTFAELFRVHGPIGVSKGAKAYLKYGTRLFKNIKRHNLKDLLFGSLVMLVLFCLLPHFKGGPSQQLVYIVFIASFVISFRYFMIQMNQEKESSENTSKWFLFIAGISVVGLLLSLFGSRIVYILLVLTAGGFLYLVNKIPDKLVNALIIFFIMLDPDFLLADDGTFPENQGGKEFMEQPTGTDAVDQGKQLGRTAGGPVELWFTNKKEKKKEGVTIKRQGRKKEDGNKRGRLKRKKWDKDQDIDPNENSNNSKDDPSDSNITIDRPLGEE